VGLAVAVVLAGCSGGDNVLPSTGKSLNPITLAALIANAAQTQNLSEKLISAVIDAESHGDPTAVSRAGAQGIMQLMPATSLQYGVANPFDADENIAGGAHYLRDLLTRYHGNIELALAAYNAGPGAVDAAHGIPAFPETRAYVARIVAALGDQQKTPTAARR
jgi:soluble lytic murein transglycosylase-like protein